MTDIGKTFGKIELSDDKQRVMDLYGGTLNRPERLHYPEDGANTALLEALLAKKALGGHIVLVDGAFDVPHPSHEWYLRHVRALAAESRLETQGLELTHDNMIGAMEHPDTVVLVTVDADAKIAAKKGNNPLKGGVPRPIYPWTARANRIAGHTFPTQNGGHRSVVDFVTVEGDLDHEGTPFESSLTLAQHLTEQGALDRLVVYGEHEATVQEAINRGVTPIVIPDTLSYESNPQTDLPWSSSAIIKRAQGALQVVQHITRPI